MGHKRAGPFAAPGALALSLQEEAGADVQRIAEDESSVQMATCIYPECNGELKTQGLAGYCDKCLQPVKKCPVETCTGWNRALAMHCRLCCQRLGEQSSDCAQVISEQGWDGLKRHDVLIREGVWAAPCSYDGFLWFLSDSGQLYRYSPFQGRVVVHHGFGEGVSYSTLLIEEFQNTRLSGHAPLTEPFAVALSRHEIKSVGLISWTPIHLCLPSGSNSKILCDSVQGFQAMDCRGGTIWCLSENTHGETSLVGADLAASQVQLWPLGLHNGIGPVAVRDSILAWSSDEIAVFDGSQVRRTGFPTGFTPAMTPTACKTLRAGLGHRPGLVCGNEIYVPGSMGGKSGFACLRVAPGGVVSAKAAWGLDHPAAYTQDRDHHLLVATERASGAVQPDNAHSGVDRSATAPGQSGVLRGRSAGSLRAGSRR
ncbi:MAG: hypothetical protein QM757_26025 [Paludibaculum sp.]